MWRGLPRTVVGGAFPECPGPGLEVLAAGGGFRSGSRVETLAAGGCLSWCGLSGFDVPGCGGLVVGVVAGCGPWRAAGCVCWSAAGLPWGWGLLGVRVSLLLGRLAAGRARSEAGAPDVRRFSPRLRGDLKTYRKFSPILGLAWLVGWWGLPGWFVVGARLWRPPLSSAGASCRAGRCLRGAPCVVLAGDFEDVVNGVGGEVTVAADSEPPSQCPVWEYLDSGWLGAYPAA